MSETTLRQLLDRKIVVIYRGLSSELCLEASQVLVESGISLFEVTMNTDDAMGAIRTLRDGLGSSASVGAGTVLEPDQVSAAHDAGAAFIISPNVDDRVIERTKELGLTSIPGGFTATEVAHAHRSGADIVKVFPIRAVGAAYLRMLTAPLDFIRTMPTGDVGLDLVPALRDAGADTYGIGVQLFGTDLVPHRRWEELREAAGKFVEAAGV